MKHARPDYDRIQDPWAKNKALGGIELQGAIPEDEPVLLIRGQDRIGWIMAAIYALITYLINGDATLVRMALAHASRMYAWPKKKTADYPEHLKEITVLDDGLQEGENGKSGD